MTCRKCTAGARGALPSLPLMGRVDDSLLSAGWGEPQAVKSPPTRHASRLGLAEAGACRPPHVGGGTKQAVPFSNPIGAANG